MEIVAKRITPLDGRWIKPESAVLNVCCDRRDYALLAAKCGMRAMQAEGSIYTAWVGEKDETLRCSFASEEAYSMSILPGGVTIVANAADGLSMGVKALWRLLSKSTSLECARDRKSVV